MSVYNMQLRNIGLRQQCIVCPTNPTFRRATALPVPLRCRAQMTIDDDESDDWITVHLDTSHRWRRLSDDRQLPGCVVLERRRRPPNNVCTQNTACKYTVCQKSYTYCPYNQHWAARTQHHFKFLVTHLFASEMTYIVSSGALNSTHSPPGHTSTSVYCLSYWSDQLYHPSHPAVLHHMFNVSALLLDDALVTHLCTTFSFNGKSG